MMRHFTDYRLLISDTPFAEPATTPKGLVEICLSDKHGPRVRVFDKTGQKIIDRGEHEFFPGEALEHQLEAAFQKQSIPEETVDRLTKKIANSLDVGLGEEKYKLLMLGEDSVISLEPSNALKNHVVVRKDDTDFHVDIFNKLGQKKEIQDSKREQFPTDEKLRTELEKIFKKQSRSKENTSELIAKIFDSLGYIEPSNGIATPSYPIFVANQVLASSDLNQLANYFENQTLLTRTKLIGVGIVDGLMVSSTWNPTGSPEATINISAGTCITPEGYYVSLDETLLTHYQELGTSTLFSESPQPIVELFNARRNARTSLHQKILLPPKSEQTTSPSGVLNPTRSEPPPLKRVDRTFDEFKDFLRNRILVLVAQQAERSRLTLLKYDTGGKYQNLLVRFFLIEDPTKSDDDQAKKLLNEKAFEFFKQQQALDKFLASNIQIGRFGYVKDNDSASLSEITAYDAFQKHYQRLCIDAINGIQINTIEDIKTDAIERVENAIDSVKTNAMEGAEKDALESIKTGALKSIKTEAVDNLDIGKVEGVETALLKANDLITSLLKSFQDITKLEDSFLEPLQNNLSETLDQQLTSNNPKYPSLQYFYDYLRTIIAAYDELKAAVVDLLDYLPDATQQRFLVLGSFYFDNLDNGTVKIDERQDYFASGINRSHFVATANVTSAKHQFRQAAFLFKRLLLLCKKGSFIEQPTQDDKDNTIQIIRSCHPMAPLSQQAIPFYLDRTTIAPYWQYVAERQINSHDRSIAYQSKADRFLAGSTPDEFYRIEGHQGKSIDDVIVELQERRKRYNLAFEIIAISLKSGEQPENSLPTTLRFHEFAQLFPGIEPLGGVPKGGTFILVYGSESKTVIADFSLPYHLRADAIPPLSEDGGEPSPPTTPLEDPSADGGETDTSDTSGSEDDEGESESPPPSDTSSTASDSTMTTATPAADSDTASGGPEPSQVTTSSKDVAEKPSTLLPLGSVTPSAFSDHPDITIPDVLLNFESMINSASAGNDVASNSPSESFRDLLPDSALEDFPTSKTSPLNLSQTEQDSISSGTNPSELTPSDDDTTTSKPNLGQRFIRFLTQPIGDEGTA